MQGNEIRIVFPKLYALSKSGQIRSFRIRCRKYREDLVIMTTKKKVEPKGKITYDKYTYTEGKNLGRANETSAWEQCCREAESMFNRLKDKGYQEGIPSDESEMKPMLAIKWDESKVIYPCMVQAKLDGVRCIAYRDNEGVHLKSRRGKEFNIPHLIRYLEKNSRLLPLDGELYNHKDLNFLGIISAVKKLSAKTDHINMIVYDKPVEGIINYDRQFKLLAGNAKNTDKDAPIKYLPTIIAYSKADIDTYHDKCIKEGFEGVIIRNFTGKYEFGYRSHNLIKLKKFFDKEFPIIRVEEATGRDKGTAIFVLKADNGKEFKARPQGDKGLRKRYLEDKDLLIGKLCTVKYQELSKYGIPRFPSAIAIRDYE